jgi:NTE family protein
MANDLCDIVLEGGGVKGIGLVGALEEISKAGYEPCRVAGTSAGAIVGALLAAGMPVKDMVTTIQTLDYTKFRDETVLSQLGVPGKGASMLLTKGIYKGDYLRMWLAAELEKLGVQTFADLRLHQPWAAKLAAEERYKLVVVASDITGGRLARFPWDYQRYGLDPDKQFVADAVRASMSIPFFYQPARLQGNYLVDGGMLSNFPIDLFDNTNDWPTFGIKLSAQADANLVANDINNTVDFAKAIVATAMSAHDQMHLDDPATVARTIFVDTFKIKATDFDITQTAQAKLYESGRKHARKFLQGWNYMAYKKAYGKKK